MAYINGKFTCFDPNINVSNDTLAIAMLNRIENVSMISRAKKIISYVLNFTRATGKIYLPECVRIEEEGINVQSGNIEIYLPKIERIQRYGLQLAYAGYLLLGNIGNGLKWSYVDPAQLLSISVYSERMTVYIDETQEDYLDFAEYLLNMADEIELFDSNGNPLEV